MHHLSELDSVSIYNINDLASQRKPTLSDPGKQLTPETVSTSLAPCRQLWYTLSESVEWHMAESNVLQPLARRRL